MTALRACFALAFASLLAACQPAPPSSPDLAYCEAMFAIHERYLLPRGFDGNELRDPMADLAVDLCRRQRSGEGIAILERKLRAANWPLPPR